MSAAKLPLAVVTVSCIASTGYESVTEVIDVTPNEYGDLMRVLHRKPIDMVLFCPQCHTQHIDAPETQEVQLASGIAEVPLWRNPPHHKHLCAVCGTLWKPARVATNGVQSLD